MGSKNSQICLYCPLEDLVINNRFRIKFIYGFLMIGFIDDAGQMTTYSRAGN